MSHFSSIGIVGAGVMGTGTAHAFAQFGYKINLIDKSSEILKSAKNQIKNDLRFQGLFDKQSKKINPDEVLSNINFTANLNDLRNDDFVVENVSEKWEIKKEVHLELDKILKADTIIAVNTSAIPITKFSSLSNRGENIIGMHFMNPVNLKPTVEVIRGYYTSGKTIETIKNFLASINKDCVIVNDSPGFVSNRVLMLTINEAIFLLQEKVATVEEIDKIFKTCFGHKMGPFETADLIGLDTILYSIEVLYESFNDSKYRPCALLKNMVNAGYHGKKNGKGFYNYQLNTTPNKV